MSRFATVRGLVLSTFVALTCLCIAACSKVNDDNYNKIQTGMTQQQVEDILGKGTDQPASASIGGISVTTTAAKNVRYGDDSKNITVTYAGDKVIRKDKKGF